MKFTTRMLPQLALVCCLYLTTSCGQKAEVTILPVPVQVEQENGTVSIDQDTKIVLNALPIEHIGSQTQAFIKKQTGLNLAIEKGRSKAGKQIEFCINKDFTYGAEGYTLDVDGDGVTITSASPKGLFYGAQSLRQLLPVAPGNSVNIPRVHILDYPRFAWRGLHLDVSRHFFTVDEVKRFIDLMAMYKLNTFHWHLTDDQGWRIEIKKYPLLTEKGAWRSRVGFDFNQEKGINKDDGKPYGGYYTQEQIRDVVAYAAQHSITVVPEIDVPGHSVAAIHAYPYLCCFPKEAAPVRLDGGVSDGVYCAGKESSFAFIQDVLDEVIDLFPAKQIHIGGDEAPKNNWKRCRLCQQRIQQEGLKDEHELQSYFISRIATYLKSRDKELIGWDEIMEGNSVDGATIMSWRGVIPGLEAARAGHKVIMTPQNYTYISCPQSINKVTKQSEDGAVLTMRKLYEYDPIPTELEENLQANIIGVQACQWSEGTPNQQILEYKEYPRAIALAEMAWSPQSHREWNGFYSRLTKHFPFLDAYNVNYGAPCYDVEMKVLPGKEQGTLQIDFKTELNEPIYYTLDGSEPSQSSAQTMNSIVLTEPATVQACQFRADGSRGRITKREVSFHKAIAKKVTYTYPYSVVHNGGGDFGLVDGIINQWQGFEKSDVDFTIDLQEVMPISFIQTRWRYDIGAWILRPLQVTYELSADGKNFEKVHEVNAENPKDNYDKGILEVNKELADKQIRYIRVQAKSQKINPKWHVNAGGASWLFIDEVVVK